jgi:uncharacterized protein YkuJ
MTAAQIRAKYLALYALAEFRYLTLRAPSNEGMTMASMVGIIARLHRIENRGANLYRRQLAREAIETEAVASTAFVNQETAYGSTVRLSRTITVF